MCWCNILIHIATKQLWKTHRPMFTYILQIWAEVAQNEILELHETCLESVLWVWEWKLNVLYWYLPSWCQRTGNGTILRICRSRSCLFHRCSCTSNILIKAGQKWLEQVDCSLSQPLELQAERRQGVLKHWSRHLWLPDLWPELMHFAALYFRHLLYFLHSII